MRTRVILGLGLATVLISSSSLAGKGDKGERGSKTKPNVTRPAGVPHERELSPAVAGLMDQLLMLQMGNRGNKQAHLFLEDAARGWNGGTAQSRLYGIRGPHRKFTPPKKDGSIVVMFGDKSGVYIHPDGFVTPMGDDISHEVHAWEEIK